MDIRTLGIIQDELRNPEQLPEMVKFVSQGGLFTTKVLAEYNSIDPHGELTIEIALFPDGKFYVHNGHHRVVAMYLAG